MLPPDEPLLEPATPSRSRLTRRGRIVLGLIITSVVLVGVAGGVAAWGMGGSADGSPVRVVIPEGATADQIAQLLEEKDVVRSAFIFRIVSRFRGVAGGLKPGAYDLRTGLGVSAAIEELRTGVPLKVFRVTIPEGKTVREIAKVVGAKTPVSATEFLRAATSGEHRFPLEPTNPKNLEGLLFPNTYDFVEEATADEMVQALLDEFGRQLSTIDVEERARALGVTPYQALVVASLIEREAKIEKDRPLVSSVIYNRIARPMRLQIDATVQYAIFLKTGAYKERLLFSDLEIESPYNTYRVDGLPPTPIAAPGLAALRAAFNPAKTDYYFYVTTDDNAHCFSRDAAGHARCQR